MFRGTTARHVSDATACLPAKTPHGPLRRTGLPGPRLGCRAEVRVPDRGQGAGPRLGCRAEVDWVGIDCERFMHHDDEVHAPYERATGGT